MAWKGYASMQSNLGRAGMTPLMNFVGNTCTSAMNSFQTVGEFDACNGVGPLDQRERQGAPRARSRIRWRRRSQGNSDLELYYPASSPGRRAPPPGADPIPKKVADARLRERRDVPQVRRERRRRRRLPPPPENRPITNCMVTVLDRYTSSFNWADTNFAAVWLRQFWYVLANSAITDVQNGGLTFVTGGDYTRSSVIDGYWSVAAKSVFVGHTQPDIEPGSRGEPVCGARRPVQPQVGARVPDQRPEH